MDKNAVTKEIEIVSGDTTKTFDKVKNDDASLYEYAGGEECILELVRGPSAECGAALRRIKWQTLKNTRFVVYVMFTLILVVFAAYYAITGTYYIAALAGVVGAFMLYMVLCGQSFFAIGMELDEKADSGMSLSVKICEKNIYIYDGVALSVAECTQLTGLVNTKKYICFKIKGVKPYADGVIFSKADIEGEKLTRLVSLFPDAK